MTSTDARTDWFPAVCSRVVWAAFVCTLGVAAWTVWSGHEWPVRGAFDVDGLTLVTWPVVTFFSGIVHSFSRRYVAADPRRDGFFARLFALTVVVLLMTAANHLALFALSWAAMGWIMADLVGHVRGWPQAEAAARLARRYFGAGSVVLALGLAVLAGGTGATTVTGVLAGLDAAATVPTLAAAGLILLAAMVQSALFPFHRWLLSSMTAPTPASAMMHAGFVNAGGILLARFAPVFAGETAAMLVVVVVGGTSTLLAQAWMLVQTDVKKQLACSTVAQMGMMILQCGLGFFTAAIAHLILHGFYKAYLFLSTGSNVGETLPKTKKGGSPTATQAAVMLVAPVAGALLFAHLTHKSLTDPDSGLILVVVVTLSVFQGTRNLVQQASLSPLVRLVGVPVALLPAIGLYAAVYNGVTAMMHDVPTVHVPTALSPVHALVAGAFVAAYVAMEMGWHRSSKRIYVALLNGAQPDPRTALTAREEYDDRR